MRHHVEALLGPDPNPINDLVNPSGYTVEVEERVPRMLSDDVRNAVRPSNLFALKIFLRLAVAAASRKD
jgi:hypothetical protein